MESNGVGEEDRCAALGQRGREEDGVGGGPRPTFPLLGAALGPRPTSLAYRRSPFEASARSSGAARWACTQLSLNILLKIAIAKGKKNGRSASTPGSRSPQLPFSFSFPVPNKITMSSSCCVMFIWIF
jgi:hypothetical protein